MNRQAEDLVPQRTGVPGQRFLQPRVRKGAEHVRFDPSGQKFARQTTAVANANRKRERADVFTQLAEHGAPVAEARGEFDPVKAAIENDTRRINCAGEPLGKPGHPSAGF